MGGCRPSVRVRHRCVHPLHDGGESATSCRPCPHLLTLTHSRTKTGGPFFARTYWGCCMLCRCLPLCMSVQSDALKGKNADGAGRNGREDINHLPMSQPAVATENPSHTIASHFLTTVFTSTFKTEEFGDSRDIRTHVSQLSTLSHSRSVRACAVAKPDTVCPRRGLLYYNAR